MIGPLKHVEVSFGDSVIDENGKVYGLSRSDKGIVWAYKGYPTAYDYQSESNKLYKAMDVIDQMIESDILRQVLNLNTFYIKYYGCSWR